MKPAKKILIIDDDEKILASLQEILGLKGYALSIAGNGKEGLKLCETTEPDLILTDIIMPDMEGIELIRSIRKRKKTIPIIAMSGEMVGRKFLKAARLLGAVDILLKPFTAEEVDQKIKNVLA